MRKGVRGKPVVKRGVVKKEPSRRRKIVSRRTNFKESSWYQKAAMSISAAPSE